MTSQQPPMAYTPDDVLRLEKIRPSELVGGRLIERRKGMEAATISAVILTRIGNFANSRGLGMAFGGRCGYLVFVDDPQRVRYADVSFIRRGRLPNEPSQGHSRVAPDLIVEVVSPFDSAEILNERISDFLRAGVSHAWVVQPVTRTVNVFRHDGYGRWLNEDEILDGGDVLPGFQCRVADLFVGIPRREAETTDEPPPK